MPRQYDVWFAIPSASVERCRKVLPVWREMGYKIAILQNRERGEVPADVCVWSDTYPGWPESINILARAIVPRTADILVSGGCDMLPDPNHSAQQLADQFYERFPDGFGVMQPHGDEFMAAKRYCGSPFLGRAFVDTMYAGAGPMCGQYHHNFADNELFWVAQGMGVLWSRPDLTHFHDHFTRHGAAQPKFWESVARHDLNDCLLYYARAHQGFPGHAPREGPGVTRAWDASLSIDEMLVLARGRLMSEAMKSPGTNRLATKLRECAEQGLRRVAIYGSGHHTRNAATALAQPPVSIECIIDDNASAHGQALWHIPIVSRSDAIARGVEAVILSADSVEQRLWDNCGEFFDAGIRVHRLYGPSVGDKQERVQRGILEAKRMGVRRLGVFGAGAHTKDVVEVLRTSGVEIAALIDDHEARSSAFPWPVVPLSSLHTLRLDAILLSSDQAELAMWASIVRAGHAGVRVIPLYHPMSYLQRFAGPRAA